MGIDRVRSSEELLYSKLKFSRFARMYTEKSHLK